MRQASRNCKAKEPRPKALLLSLPWTTLTEPSLGLGILKAVLSEHDVLCTVRHLNVEMLRFVRPLTYYTLANSFALNDFLFSAVLDPVVTTRQQRLLREKARQSLRFNTINVGERGGFEGFVRDLLHLRNDIIPVWLDEVAREIAEERYTLIGLSCMFDQTVASIALAKVIKQYAPERLIALGGYAVRDPTGPAVLRAFPWIDAVCAGEGENVIGPLAQASIGMPLSGVPGIYYRSTAGSVLASPAPPSVSMNSVPTPEFDDFFRDVADLERRHRVRIVPDRLPLENSRGCWWGAKHHCVFCGIHDDDLHYRAKDAAVVLESMDELYKKYGIAAFRYSDYILPQRYYETLLPELISRGRPYRLSSELKANVTAERLALLARAGFEEVQPGIESFSTKVLRAMRKGVTAIQNVHLLREASRRGVLVHYNLLYGFPTDDESDYWAMVEMLPRLRHLDPPSTRIEVQVTRYAPMQADPHRFGYAEPVHEPSYELIFSERFVAQSGFDLNAFCYYFLRPFENAPGLSRAYRAIDRLVDSWKLERRKRAVELSYRLDDGRMTVMDGRAEQPTTHILSEEETAMLLACDAPQTIDHVTRRPGGEMALRHLDELGFVFCSDGKVLSLVLPDRHSSHCDSDSVIWRRVSANVDYAQRLQRDCGR